MMSSKPSRAKPKSSKPTELEKQVNATRRMADESDANSTTVALVRDAADTVAALQLSRQRKAAAASVSPIWVISPEATPQELRNARICRAVQRGKSVYLPSWRESVVGLPNAFLRSALFSVTGPVTDSVFEHPIAVQGEISITLTGHKLVDYDRQVFATVLNYYAERPLADTDSEWIKVTYWQFAAAMGLKSGPNVHKAIHDSLVRLNAAHLRLRVNRRDIPLPHLLEAIFYDGPLINDGQVRAKSGFEFRVPAGMAELYGPNDWTKVSSEALRKYSGLVRWLVTFYRTHGGAYPLAVLKLHKLSGSTCTLFEFRRRLKVGLTKLQGEATPDEIRVSKFTLDTETDELIVHLSRWSEPKLLL